jgi:hypothetical protein
MGQSPPIRGYSLFFPSLVVSVSHLPGSSSIFGVISNHKRGEPPVQQRSSHLPWPICFEKVPFSLSTGDVRNLILMP